MKKNKKSGPLGRGLEALIPKYQSDMNERYIDNVKLQSIVTNSNQPRQKFDIESMQELIDSIDQHGIIQPLTVRKIEHNKYELVAGERRYRAAKTLKLSTIPVYIIQVKSDEEMLQLALIENIQRENLNCLEEAEGYAILKGKYALSDKAIATKVGKQRSTITNKLRLIKLPPELKLALKSGKSDFSEGHARAILGIRESSKMKNIFRRIKKDALSVRATEKLVRFYKNKKIKAKKNIRQQGSVSHTKFENQLVSHLGTKVILKKNNNDKGNINIYFDNNSDLERIVEIILNED